ncbi:MAG: DNA-processing protein DprA [Candidatus Cloacimonadales bacterium]|nr:DNA-processing protein DprA [Candidatus Cloacimonadales bacterium]
MENLENSSYWMALAHLPRWRTERINRLIVDILQEKKMTYAEFFSLDKNNWQNEFELNSNEIAELETAKKELPNYSFLAESLINQGYNIVPIDSADYSPTLKANLKLKFSPPVIYIKGNKQLLQEDTVAIVGSRNASDISLQFTKTVAQKCAKEYKVVVSGFAKGVDKKALDETLAVVGHSIIVLPQGIMTFSSGFRKYYSQIVQGDVLVLSTFHPKVPWSAGLAMSRNVYIYGLAKTIYAAESDSKGGTWSGVLDGLKKGREIYVRKPGSDEKNANELLILAGAKPVDSDGNILIEESSYLQTRLKDMLSSQSFTIEEIIEKLKLKIESENFSKILSGLDFIERKRINKQNYFYLKERVESQMELF